MVQRISPEGYLSDNTENTEQPNNTYNYYYSTEPQTENQTINNDFIYLGIFIAGLFIGYLMAKHGS